VRVNMFRGYVCLCVIQCGMRDCVTVCMCELLRVCVCVCTFTYHLSGASHDLWLASSQSVIQASP